MRYVQIITVISPPPIVSLDLSPGVGGCERFTLFRSSMSGDGRWCAWVMPGSCSAVSFLGGHQNEWNRWVVGWLGF